MEVTPVDPTCERCGKLKSQHAAYQESRGVRVFCNGSDAGKPFRRRTEDMPGLGIAPHPSVPLGSYVHDKSGGQYEVVGGVFDASGEGDSVLVLYQAVPAGFLACRPPVEFVCKFRSIPS